MRGGKGLRRFVEFLTLADAGKGVEFGPSAGFCRLYAKDARGKSDHFKMPHANVPVDQIPRQPEIRD